MATPEHIQNLASADIAERGLPTTQNDCCALAARVAVTLGAKLTTDQEFLDAASAGARGLFGPAYEQADERQRQTWIDMYETALRQASGA